MKDLFQEIKKSLSEGEEAVLATIISSSGSTPRRMGAKMLIKQDGGIRGSIGGGAVEYQSMKKAMELMKKKVSGIKEFSLTRSQAADIGMVCGGNICVYFQYISPKNNTFPSLCNSLLEALEKREKGWLLWDLTEEETWQMELFLESGMADEELQKKGIKIPGAGRQIVLWEQNQRRYFAEPLVMDGRVYIFGGGHVAQELVPLLAHVGFSCIVMDDREEFANPKVFPKADGTVVGDLEHIEDVIHINREDYVCIMTRGHQYDYYVQKQAMAAHPCYIGVMGSKNKIRVVSGKLIEDGFSKEELDACHMPIGTEILAQTPAEIAVSIAGELIFVRAERLGLTQAGKSAC